MSYKFMIPGKPSRWADTSGLLYRSYSTYTGASDGPTPTSLASGSLNCTTGSSTEISSFSISAGNTYVWRGYFAPDSSQNNWRFRTTSDDGSYLWLDTDSETPITALDRDDAIVKNGGNHGLETVTSGDISLTAGFYYPIVLMAGNNTGTGSVTLEWSGDGGSSWSSSGASYLSHDSRWPDGFGEDLYSGSACLQTWVAVGDNGHIATNNTLTSGSTWTTYVAPAGATVEKRSIAYGADPNGTNVFFVGHNYDLTNELMSSSAPLDGVDSWSVVDPGGIGGIYGIAYSSYGGTSWIGVGNSGETVRLSSGSWSNTDIGTDNIWSVATDANGTWVANTSTSNRNWAIYKSVNDGATWTSSRSSWIGAGVVYTRKHVSYGNGVWVVTFGTEIWSASDSDISSNTWTQRQSGGSDHFNDVQYGTDSKWMAIGHGRDVYISTNNGTSWSQATDIPGSDEPTGLAYHDGNWVVVTDGTVNNIVVSDDHGSSWTVIASTGGSLNEIAVNSVLPNS